MTANHPVEVPDALHDLMHAWRHRLRAAVQTEITLNEMRVLMFIGRHPMRTQKELVEHSGSDKAQITRLLHLLEEKGWLQREPHAQDARIRCLTLSPAGLAAFEAMGERRRGIAAQMLDGLSGAEQQQLLGLLARMQANLDRAG